MAKIIVADNDREFRELAVFALRFAGYETFGASDGEECCRLYKQTKPDLILIHINLPDMNGYETCKILKSDLDTASIPVILMATETDKPKAQAGLGESDVTIISKPIGPDQLTEKVHSFIKRGLYYFGLTLSSRILDTGLPYAYNHVALFLDSSIRQSGRLLTARF